MRKDTGLIFTILTTVLLGLGGLVYLASRQAPTDDAVTHTAGERVADGRLQSLEGEVVAIGDSRITVRTAEEIEMTFTVHEATRVVREDLPVGLDGIGPGDPVTVSYVGTPERRIARLIAVGGDAEG